MADRTRIAATPAVVESGDARAQPLRRVNAYIAVHRVDGQEVMRCRCGSVLGAATDDYKRLSLEARYPIQHAGPFANPYQIGGDRFELREYYCPTCLVLFETDVAMRGDPNVRDVELAASERDPEVTSR